MPKVILCDKCGSQNSVKLIRIIKQYSREKPEYHRVGYLCANCFQELLEQIKQFMEG